MRRREVHECFLGKVPRDRKGTGKVNVPEPKVKRVATLYEFS